MEISAGIQASLAGRYAVALFELAAEDGVVSAVESDLETLSAALAESSELASLIDISAAGEFTAGKRKIPRHSNRLIFFMAISSLQCNK